MKSSFLFRLVLLMVMLVFLGPQTESKAQSSWNLALHYVEGIPNDNEDTYTVKTFLSVVGGDGKPIAELPSQVFQLTEDSQTVAIQSIDASTETLSLIWVQDTSNSMAGLKMDDTKAALLTFVSSLKPDDQFALLTFNDNYKNQLEFTTNREVSTKAIQALSAVRESGSCVYDAAYAAIQLASNLPFGNRAVVLFTDGKDETYRGAICSTKKLEDLILLATASETHVPIYTVRMGGDKQDPDLTRLAELTGGLYLFAPSSGQLANTFQSLSTLLTSQYLLSYTSFAIPGSHTLTVTVRQSGNTAVDTRNFTLPAFPTRLVILSPHNGETISNTTRIIASLKSQSEPVLRVVFEVNGVLVGEFINPPYELDLSPFSYPPGVLVVSAIAYGANNRELTRSTVTLNTNPEPAPTNLSTILPTTPSLTTPIVSNDKKYSPQLLLGTILGVLGIVIIVLLIIMLNNHQQNEKWHADKPDDKVLAKARQIALMGNREQTSSYQDEPWGELIVEASDDPNLIGYRYKIIRDKTRIGRSEDNHLPFPQDIAVSRKHAEIEKINGFLHLRQVAQIDNITGEYRYPRYGTTVNGKAINTKTVMLRNDDLIQLGTRVLLKFETSMQIPTIRSQLPTQDMQAFPQNMSDVPEKSTDQEELGDN